MKSKKRIIIPVVCVAVVAAAIIAVPRIVSGGVSLPAYEANALTKMDLKNTVSVTGTVKSEDAANVYSTLAYQVKAVNVKVGDAVKVGDVLCELDTTDLEASILQQTTSINNALAKAQQNLSVAKNQLEIEKFNQENNVDTQLANYESAVKNAELNLESSTAKLTADKKALREYRDMIGGMSEYDPTEDTYKQAVVQSDITVQKAQQALEDAKATLKAYKKNKNILDQEAVVSGQNQVNSAALNTNLSDQWMQIDKLKEDLEKAIVKAPVSGVVTAVIAKEGGSGQGLLFVIEDTAKLKIDTKVKEYDIASVKTGLPVVIKSDGTGDDEYDGKVAKIAPTAIKAANGDTVETTDVQFATEIGVTQSGTRLKIGMNARMDIITEEKAEVFAVPYDAVVENENGESIVYIARPQTIVSAENGEGNMPPVSMSEEEYSQLQTEGEAGQEQINKTREAQEAGRAANGQVSFVAVAVTVTTGMETDFYLEISSDQLKEGDLIIANPIGITAGMQIMVTDPNNPAAAMTFAGGPQMAVRMG